MRVAAISVSIRFWYLVTTAANITLYFQIHKFSEDYFRYLSPHKVLEAKKEKRKPRLNFRFSILIFGELAPIPSICPHDYRSFPLKSVSLRPK